MRTLFIFILFISSFSFGQDSLYVSKTYPLPEIRYPICIMWENLAVEEYEKNYRPKFDSVAIFLNNNKHLNFEIRVYTDNRGSDSANLLLSHNRAKGWYDGLIESGVDSTQIVFIGNGERSPRTVWLMDSVYYLEKPNNPLAVKVLLSEKYINSFRRTDRKRFELLHYLNRREEIVVVE